MTGRHLTTAITLLVLCGLLLLAGVVGVKTMLSPIPGSLPSIGGASPAPTCSTESVKKGQRIRSREVVVSVFNAGSTVGLADRTLHALAKRGFRKGDAGNAPSNVQVRFVQVWTAKPHDATAKLVAMQFGHKTRIKITRRELGQGVDVVVGDHFSGHLRKAPRSITVHTGQQVCVATTGATNG